MKAAKIFWLFTASVFFALILPTLVQDGMFLDGITYSSISKNLANGIGSFWKPQYTKILYPAFYEHPPLVFGIQSLFFRILGNGIYTERVYTLFTALLTAYGIVLCWGLFNKNNGISNYSWLPVLLWITVPLVFWSYKNNMLENTMGIFTLFSVYFISRALLDGKMAWLIPGSILIVMAFLSKGFVGLFPISTVIVYSLVLKPKRPGITGIYFLITFILPILLFSAVVIAFPESKINFSSYIHQQLLPALNNQREVTTDNRFSIVFRLLTEISIPVCILIFFFIRQKISKSRIPFNIHNAGLFFFLIGLSASLPLIISLKQHGFYLIPSFPFLMLAISSFLVPYIKNYMESITEIILTWIKRVALFLMAITLLFSIFRFGKYSRDEKMLKDIYIISHTIPAGTILNTTREIWQDWAFVAYIYRIGGLSLDCDHDHEFIILRLKDDIAPGVKDRYDKMDLDLKEYIVLTKKPVLTIKKSSIDLR